MKRIAVFLFAAMLMVDGAESAAKKSPSLWRTKKDIAAKKQKERRIKAEKRKKVKEEQRTLAELERLDKNGAALRKELKGYQDEIGHTNAQIVAMRRRQKLTTAEMDSSRDRLREFLRAWRQGSSGGEQAESAIWCASAEAGRLSNARLSRFELKQREGYLKEYRVRQESLKSRIAKKKREVEAVRSSRARLLRSVRASKKRMDRLLAETVSSRRGLESRMSRILSEQRRLARVRAARSSRARAPASSFAGSLAWPVRGKVVRKFGKHKHAEFNAVVYSSGVEIAARRGSPVTAAASGRVVHQGWIKGYGRVMIVDHGNDFWTVYGHLQDFRVREKQTVKRGMVIGTVGDTGSLRGVSLYFEVRVKGVAKNPKIYLRAAV